MNLSWLLFSFEGRLARQPFWTFTLVTTLVMLVPAIALFGFGTQPAENFVTISSLVLVWPSLAVQVKRWHDRNKSGLWVLVNLVPLIGALWAMVETGFLPGTEGPNTFGADPLQTQSPAEQETAPSESGRYGALK